MVRDAAGGSDAGDVTPGVSVLVCTRDRPASMERAARAILASHGVDLQLVVVDQSRTSATADRLRALGDPRVAVTRIAAVGKPGALNHGLTLVRNEIVVITDDDCEPPPAWVGGMAAVFRDRPHVGLVFSNVVPPPYDHRRGYVPTYERTSD